MILRDYAKSQIDTLPDKAIEKIVDFISFQRFSLGYEDDTEYLMSVPTMKEKILEGLNTPIDECVSLEEVW